jgi:heme/copper-type cytochrome/quinol oxidase subunit 2
MKKITLIAFSLLMTFALFSQESEDEQNRESMAMDATAAQWSFQLAYQSMPDYYSDDVNGTTRSPGLDNYLQLRVVAPIPLKGLTILPRLTFRHYENKANGKSGLGNTELFALIIPKFSDWGSGRAGIGPLVTFPGNADVAKDEWGYGVAAAIVNNSGQ